MSERFVIFQSIRSSEMQTFAMECKLLAINTCDSFFFLSTTFSKRFLSFLDKIFFEILLVRLVVFLFFDGSKNGL